MIKRRIACILLILSAFILYFFANDTVTLALLLALIAMPAASIGMLALSGKELRLSLEDSEVVSEKPVMKLILENLRGNVNRKHIGAYDEGIYMMKYNEVKIVKEV